MYPFLHSFDRRISAWTDDVVSLLGSATTLEKQFTFKGNRKAQTPPLPGHKDQVLAVAVSHDAKLLASGGYDKVPPFPRTLLSSIC